MSLADRVTAFALFLGRNIDWIAAAVVVLAYFAIDQGWIMLSPETIAGALTFVAALRGYVEKHNRGKAPSSGAAALLVLVFALPLVGCAGLAPGGVNKGLDQADKVLQGGARAAMAAEVILDNAERACAAQSPLPADSPCLALPEARKRLDLFRAALSDASATHQTLADRWHELADLLDAAGSALTEAD